MKYIPPEKIWEKFKNRYEVIILASQKVRELIEEAKEGRTTIPEKNVFIYALKRVWDEAGRKPTKRKEYEEEEKQ